MYKVHLTVCFAKYRKSARVLHLEYSVKEYDGVW